MEQNDLVFIQDQIGYRFKNLDLLQQAFIRRSYAKENGGEDNEVLEFIGDKALDFVIVKLLAEKYGYFAHNEAGFDSQKDFDEFVCVYRENKLTELKKKLVEKNMLAYRMDMLDLADFLIMGNGDIRNHINKEDSVKEDLFEAIIGAVALDCNWDFEEIQSVVEIMLDPDSYLSDDKDENYVELIQEWTLKKCETIPLYHFEKTTMQRSWYLGCSGIPTQAKEDCRYLCLLKLGDGMPIFRGFGKSKNDARKDVCELAYHYLKENDLLFSIKDEIDNPNKNDAISQLEILARRGYFSIPVYDFMQEYDNNGNPVWKCRCRIDEIERYFISKSSSKKDAKKNAAFGMLRYVLNCENL